jgi:hypothetical protein
MVWLALAGGGAGAPAAARAQAAADQAPVSSALDLRTPEPGAPEAETEATARPRYPLRELPDGQGWRYEGESFSATIAPDGAVTFDDRRGRVRPGGLPDSLLHGDFVGDEWDDTVPTARTAPALPVYGSAAFTRPGDVPGYALLQSLPLPDPPSMRRLPLQPSLGGPVLQFDLTDVYMRHHGEDPYQAEKADFLAATFEFRMQAAAQFQQSTTRIALAELPDRLEQIWADPGLGREEKRQVLFALRDETSDTPEGHDAWRIIDGFIREKGVR